VLRKIPERQVLRKIPAVTAVMTAMTACGAMIFVVSMPISGLVCRWHTSQFLLVGS